MLTTTVTSEALVTTAIPLLLTVIVSCNDNLGGRGDCIGSVFLGDGAGVCVGIGVGIGVGVASVGCEVPMSPPQEVSKNVKPIQTARLM